MPPKKSAEFFSHGPKSPKLARKLTLLIVYALTLCVLTAACGFMSFGGPKRSGKSYVINGKRYYILATADGYKEKGLASWYGDPFHGRRTASGEIYDKNELSAAHKTLPLRTWVEVKNLKNNKIMYLRINDRGPFIAGRIIDLSQAAAVELGVYRPGTAPVVVTAVPATRAKRLEQSRVKSLSKKLSARASPK
ncbi:MAG: septal ring lytic transglycosylase RlpA family protein [Deltaproteobacteria bacterium]|jgi:rare lipoprotein A|nr:septal ring lytic transglycosylase RlpA family protein [Deltaproteobacteria bacterium]